MTTVAEWREPFREGIVYYLEEQRVKGVLLWNVRGKLKAARRLVMEQARVSPEELIGALGK